MAVILIIEDQHIKDAGLVQKLKDNYHDAITVDNGQAAMDEISKRAPCAIISDINLPDQNGINFFQRIRKSPETQEIQIFIYTDEIDIKTEAALKALKIYDLFTKKNKIEYLIEGIERFCREELQRRQQQLLGDDYGNNDETVHVKTAFQELYKGLEQQLTKEDYDTHYELGITYMDLGIINSAIKEFQLAAQSPLYSQASCYMISQCLLQRNMPTEAILCLKRGLSKAPNNDEIIGLHYEMALILKNLGREEEALSYLQRVREKDEDFRDTTKLIAELQNKST